MGEKNEFVVEKGPQIGSFYFIFRQTHNKSLFIVSLELRQTHR